MNQIIMYSPVGIIHTPFTEPSLTPIQSRFSRARGWIELFPEFAEGLSGIDQFTHLILLYNFDRAAGPSLKTAPLVDASTSFGIFAMRHFNRPNPLGISLVRLERRDGCRLFVTGIDILDGTPLLDLKPYIPSFDSVPDAGSGWLSRDHINEIERESIARSTGKEAVPDPE